MKEAYQVYDGLESMSKGLSPVFDNGKPEFKLYCSECGCPAYSEKFPTERKECPNCHAKFSPDKIMKFEKWISEPRHVGYTLRECGREQ